VAVAAAAKASSKRKKAPTAFMTFQSVCSTLSAILWNRWALSVPAPTTSYFKVSVGNLGKMGIAKKDIPKHTFIARYNGGVVKEQVSPNYAIELGEFNFDGNGKPRKGNSGTEYMMDASLSKSNKHDASVFNHSCKKFNCEMVSEEHTKRVSYHQRGVYKSKSLTCSYIAAFTLRKIKKGEEILVNYDDERAGTGPFYFDTKAKTEANLKKSKFVGTSTRCLCEAGCKSWFNQF
jgi:hypothetical protein